MAAILRALRSTFKRHKWEYETVTDCQVRTCKCCARVQERGYGTNWQTVE